MKLFSINVKLAATAYIKAESEGEAKRILLERIGTEPGFDGEDDIRDAIEDDQFQAPELSGFSLSPAMTYHGVWDEDYEFELAAEDVPPPEDDEPSHCKVCSAEMNTDDPSTESTSDGICLACYREQQDNERRARERAEREARQ